MGAGAGLERDLEVAGGTLIIRKLKPHLLLRPLSLGQLGLEPAAVFLSHASASAEGVALALESRDPGPQLVGGRRTLGRVIQRRRQRRRRRRAPMCLVLTKAKVDGRGCTCV